MYILRTQPNAWIHACATVCVCILAAWLQTPARDWAVLILTIATVWVAEMVNTAAETLVDIASPGYSLAAKHVKDVCAGAVLLTAVAAVSIGLLILGPPLWIRLQQIGLFRA
jgi:diacylglycerol kinase